MVVRWIREGLLEDRKTGAHHKIPMTSVHALREQRVAAGRDAVGPSGTRRSMRPQRGGRQRLGSVFRRESLGALLAADRIEAVREAARSFVDGAHV
jgi:hypothetical protein